MISSRDTSFSSIETFLSSGSDEGKRRNRRRSSVPAVLVHSEPFNTEWDRVNGEEKANRRVKVNFPLGTHRDSLESLKEKQEDEEDMRRSSTVPDTTRNLLAQKPGTRSGRIKSLGAIYKDSPLKDANNSRLLSLAIKEEVHKRRLMKKLRFILRLRVLLHRWWRRHSPTEVASTHPFYMQFEMINDSMEEISENGIDFKASYYRANKQMRMSQEAKRILMMKPEQRTQAEIYYAMIALRGIETIADYPLRMQQNLAAHGRFESYGPKRIIVKQGHRPEGFYFILFGTVVVAILETGSPYAKTRVTLRRGENFGELAIAHRINRQSTVITMEKTEFLVIDCDTYENIFMAGGKKTLHDPDHNRFMRSLYFLKDFPMEEFENNPRMMHFCYFRRNTVMVEDSNNSDWIYIVKSGSLRVYKKLIKCYPTISKRTGNHHQLANTDGFMSFLSQEAEYHRFAVYNEIDLPPPLSPGTDSDEDPHMDKAHAHSEEKENLLGLPLMQRVERLIRPRTSSGVIATYGQSSVKRNIQSAKASGSKSRRTNLNLNQSPHQSPRSISRSTAMILSTENTTLTQTTVTDNTGVSATADDQSGKRTLLDDYESSSKHKRPETPPYYISPGVAKKHTSDIDPNAISKRFSRALVTEFLKKEITAADLDPEFVLVQTLTKGQAFGLQQIFCENQPSLYLVSHGAECIMLNKKFYKDHVDANMAQRLKQQISPYPTEEVLQENLRTRVNWMEYRKVTLRNLIKEQTDGKPPRLKQPTFK